MTDRRQGARLHRHRDLFAGEVPAWRADAACRGQTALFYAVEHQAEALIICAGCPVLEACRSWALGPPDPVPGGVAGGMSHRARIRMRKALRAGTAA